MASKVCEKPRYLKDVVTVFEYVKKIKEGYGRNRSEKNAVPVLDLNSFEYTDLKQSVVEAERYVLKEIGFGVW